MEMLLPLLSSLVTSLPTLVIDVVLLVVAIARWNQHPKVSMLAATSSVLLLVGDLLFRAAFTVLPLKAVESGRDPSDLTLMYGVLSVASGLVHALALGLLVAAVFSDRRPVLPSGRPGGA